MSDGLSQEERRARGKEVLATIPGSSDPEGEFEDLTEKYSGGLAELVTDFVLGEIWTRPNLDRRIRSFVVIAALIASGRTDPLGIHVRGAVNHGATPAEIREVIIQMAAYVGFPAAVTAMQTAERIFEEMGS